MCEHVEFTVQPASFIPVKTRLLYKRLTGTGHTSLSEPSFNPSIAFSHFADEEKEVTS